MASFSKGTVPTTDNNDPCPCGAEGCNAPPPPPDKLCECGKPMHVYQDRHRSGYKNWPHIGGVCCECAEKKTALEDGHVRRWMQIVIKECHEKRELVKSPLYGWTSYFDDKVKESPNFWKSYSAQRILAMRAEGASFNKACMQAFVGHEPDEHKRFTEMLDGIANRKPAAPPPADTSAPKRAKRA